MIEKYLFDMLEDGLADLPSIYCISFEVVSCIHLRNNLERLQIIQRVMEILSSAIWLRTIQNLVSVHQSEY